MKHLKALLASVLTALMLSALTLPVAADAIVEPWYYIFTPAGAILSVILVIAVVLLTLLLIRAFFGKKKDGDDRHDKP